MSTRALRIAPWAASMIAVTAALACGDDPAGDPSPITNDASSDAELPDAGGIDPPPVFDGGPIPPGEMSWQLLPDVPSDGTRAGTECSIAVDAEDRVLVTYGESADGYAAPYAIPVFRQDGSTWTAVGGAPLVSEAASLAGWPNLAVAKDGTIYVAYLHDGPKVQRFSGDAWSALPAPPFGDLLAVTVDSAGALVIVGRNGAEPGALVRFDGEAWSTPTSPPVDFTGGPGFLLEGVLTAAPLPDGSLAVLARTTSTSLQAFTLFGTTWSPLGAELADQAEFPMLASSPGGGLAAAWSAGDNVFAARFDPAAQAFMLLGGALGQPKSRYAVVALDAFDRPFVAWREQDVVVSTFVAGAWSALPAPGRGGTLPAIALDRHGLPVICWQEGREAGGSSVIHVARAVAR